MAIGDSFVDKDGAEYEIVWAGGEGLVADRETKTSPDSIWAPPPRLYNKTGNHAKDPDFWAGRARAKETKRLKKEAKRAGLLRNHKRDPNVERHGIGPESDGREA